MHRALDAAMAPETTSRDVTGFCRQMEALGIEIWIDGGWGVDALLGKQTRPHADLDILVQERDLAAVVAFLESRGFQELSRDDSRPWNFVLGDGKDKEVDLHVIVIDEEGNGVYGPSERGEGRYPADALQGKGTIDSIPVRCICSQPHRYQRRDCASTQVRLAHSERISVRRGKAWTACLSRDTPARPPYPYGREAMTAVEALTAARKALETAEELARLYARRAT